MSSNSSRSSQFSSSGTRVHRDLFADNKAIGDKFANRLARVRISDFVDFIWIEPNLALTAANDGGSEPFLSAKIDPKQSNPSQ